MISLQTTHVCSSLQYAFPTGSNITDKVISKLMTDYKVQYIQKIYFASH